MKPSVKFILDTLDVNNIDIVTFDAHTFDGANLTGITRFSAMEFQRMLDKRDQTEGVAIISSVEIDRVSAVATYLAAFVRK